MLTCIFAIEIICRIDCSVALHYLNCLCVCDRHDLLSYTSLFYVPKNFSTFKALIARTENVERFVNALRLLICLQAI